MDFIPLIFFFLIMIPSAILHEYMHGWVADRLGDPTARYAGRLTLNPIVHVDLMGTIVLPIGLFVLSGGQFLFAHAKPVPYNPYNLKSQRIGPMLVAIAGPLSNFALALAFGFLVRLFPDGAPIVQFLSIIIYANILLCVFNLVPIPPLDGSKVLYAFMPSSWWRVRQMLEQFGFVFLLIFVLFFFQVIHPIIEWLYAVVSGGTPVFF